jgi:hypothetical protein
VAPSLLATKNSARPQAAAESTGHSSWYGFGVHVGMVENN